MGQDRQWPKHPATEWRETLEMARNAGWFLMLNSDHSWGAITCNPDLDRDSRCGITVFSTGKGTESVARSFRKKIDRCRHPKKLESSTVDRACFDRAQSHVQKAQRLVTAAERLHAEGRQAREAEELFQQALVNVENAEQLLEQAVAVETELKRSIGETLSLAGSEPPEPSVLLTTAEREVECAVNLVCSAGNDTTGARIKEDCEQLRDRIDTLHRKLSH